MTTVDYVTHTEFQEGIKGLKQDMQTMELRLSKQLGEKIYDTYLKLLPIILTLFGMQLGATFLVVRSLVE
jgi:hypothetical protein